MLGFVVRRLSKSHNWIDKLIYICIPAHNEEQTIGLLLWKVRSLMSEFGRDYEILVFNDNSTDRTGAVLEKYRSKLPLRVLRKDEPVGKSVALELLLREAVASTKYPKRDSAITLQADFSENPEAIVALARALEGGSDVVVGSIVASNVKPFFLGKASRFLAEILLGKAYHEAPVSDPFSGLRAYRLIVLKKAFDASKKRSLVASKGWLANLELLRALVPYARKISEISVESSYRSMSRPIKFSPIGTFRGILRVRQEVVWEN
ncbi:MAG TPA: glycosyltransferase family 2 protein [Gemmatimonadetes bacterium]|nr:glycosyltransferase family 2 protein [Gemmatimonadota bacterium]